MAGLILRSDAKQARTDGRIQGAGVSRTAAWCSHRGDASGLIALGRREVVLDRHTTTHRTHRHGVSCRAGKLPGLRESVHRCVVFLVLSTRGVRCFARAVARARSFPGHPPHVRVVDQLAGPLRGSALVLWTYRAQYGRAPTDVNDTPQAGTMLTSLGARTITRRTSRPASARWVASLANASRSSSSSAMSGATSRRSRSLPATCTMQVTDSATSNFSSATGNGS